MQAMETLEKDYKHEEKPKHNVETKQEVKVHHTDIWCHLREKKGSFEIRFVG
jgi:hypothetical protein